MSETGNFTIATQTPLETPPAEGGDAPPANTDPNAELRAYNERLKEENRKFRTTLMEAHLQGLGLTAETGLGKAIAKEYEGEMTPEAVAEFAKSEYGHDSATAEASPPAVATAERIAQVAAQSTPITPPPPADPVADAEEKVKAPDASRDDAVSALSVKMERFVQEHYGVRGPEAPQQ